jgi:hypothetical protein
MLRVLLGLFVVAHGLVTFGIWAAPVTERAPFNPSHSWLLGNARTEFPPLSRRLPKLVHWTRSKEEARRWQHHASTRRS